MRTAYKCRDCPDLEQASVLMKAGQELGWLNEVSSVPLQQAVRHRYPRYESREGRQSAEYTRRYCLRS